MTDGVPATYNDSTAAAVIDGLLQARSLKDIAISLNVSPSTINKWMRNNPLFADSVKHARAEAAHALVDEAIEIADDKTEHPGRARNRIHARLFAAERRNRKEYSQSVDVNLTERVDIGGALIEARKRIVLPGSDLAQITDAQVIDVSPHNAMRTTDKETAAHVPVVNPFD